MLNKSKTALFGLILCLELSCTAVYRNHGYAPSDQSLAKILIGVDTRESVKEALGIPTTNNTKELNSMYFISSRWSHYGVLAPKPVFRQIVAIKFDSSDMVENISRYELADGEVVALSRRITSGGAKEISFIKQIMGNFGRLDARDVLGQP